jgi:hypothetical protein
MKRRGRAAKHKKRTTISLSADLLAKGFERAHADRRTFSNYLETLVAKDIRPEEEVGASA